MVNCTCVVQAGQASDRNRDVLQLMLDQFTKRSFGQEAAIYWLEVAPGNGFTAGKPSSSSVVSMTASEGISPTRRESLLRELVALWTEHTGCSVDEVVAVIADPVTP